MEGSLLALSTIWMHLSTIDLLPHLRLHFMHVLMGAAVGVGLASGGTLLFWLGKFSAFQWLAGLRHAIVEDLAPKFACITAGDIIALSLASGFCEEIMFRGVLQDQFGLLGASVLFGVLHVPSLRYPQYGIWALTAGFLLGGLYEFTHSLWVPISAHTINNLLGLAMLRWIGTHPTESKV
jgi:membrane protease YdiL (CAAX protease family)